MKKAGILVWELTKLAGVMFVALLIYSIINALLLEAAGGMDALEASGLFTVFFLLQTGGVLALITVYYRNRLLPKSKLQLPARDPLSPVWTRRLIGLGIAAIAASYIILFMIIT
ncbi:hypothetical protein [Alkalicoccus luteus]|uniref:Uncharacterized protein n=1 Tax=Alkalicoccus luteus TaxID=1237094 RepID=A0A969PTA2_9BACI|nr:hypothetical protein [Alkalicoccus luteus]NJP39105.1 hypothetical protein [Alkalicoccus luteus]